MKLYELTEQFLALQDLVYDPEVDDQVLQDTMDGLWGESEEKADGYARRFQVFYGLYACIPYLVRYSDKSHTLSVYCYIYQSTAAVCKPFSVFFIYFPLVFS